MAFVEAAAADVNAAVAEALVEEMKHDDGVTFCAHRLWEFEQHGSAVTAYVSGWCESFGIVAELVEPLWGQGIDARFDLEYRGGWIVVSSEFGSPFEDDPSVFPPSLRPPGPNTPVYPREPLLQAAAHFGAVEEMALGSTAACAEIAGFGYPDYSRAVAYWIREGRPSRLDPDGNGRPCEETYGSAAVSRYFDAPLTQFAQDVYCRDISAMGFGFDTAVAYWLVGGVPRRMDADGNGIPCETVYSPAEVNAFVDPARDFGVGLYCRDLEPAGADYSTAVAYWLLEGVPSRMDADGNGIPCETVYSGDDMMQLLPAAWQVTKPMPSGLMCSDLHASWPYGSALRYWLQEGSPDRMDADRNGIPCQTRYAAALVEDVLLFDRRFRVR